MRVFVVSSLAVVLAGAAAAQPPRVTIEDDVSHENAMRCAALRLAQVSAGASDPVVKAARDAWLASLEAQHGVKVRDEVAARAASVTPQQMAALADACAPFEIRSTRQPVG